jgi:hypothetical protein
MASAISLESITPQGPHVLKLETTSSFSSPTARSTHLARSDLGGPSTCTYTVVTILGKRTKLSPSIWNFANFFFFFF